MPKGWTGDTKHMHYPDAQGNLPAQEGQSSEGLQKAPAYRPSVAKGGGSGKGTRTGRNAVTAGGGAKLAKQSSSTKMHNPMH